ncbi:MAG: hypothetical protein KatS3mg008_0754 [Acidimicrobiales bacterium]|nr:MAG: hypothetical protein KatS3mg008_0754 [Acidimicrobiales bacterium]
MTPGRVTKQRFVYTLVAAAAATSIVACSRDEPRAQKTREPTSSTSPTSRPVATEALSPSSTTSSAVATTIPPATCTAFDEFMTYLASLTRDSPPEELTQLKKAGEQLAEEAPELRGPVADVLAMYESVLGGKEITGEQQRRYDEAFSRLVDYLPCRRRDDG